MLSRVAERVYWTARYLERVENTARQVGVYASLLLDLPSGIDLSWYNLVRTNSGEAAFDERYKVRDERNVVKFLLADDTNPGALLTSLRLVRENVRTTREVMPSETWEKVNELYHHVAEHVADGIGRRHRHHFLTYVIGACQQLQGLLNTTMSHYSGWEFMRIGRNLERADMTTRILDTGALLIQQARKEDLPPLERVAWISVLRSVSGNQAFRQAMRVRVGGEHVARFLLTDPHFPRAVAFCLARIDEAVGNLPRRHTPVRAVRALQREAFVGLDCGDLGPPFHAYLDDLQSRIGALHTTLAQHWFAPPSGD